MLYLIIGIIIGKIYCEWLWKDVSSGKRTYEDIDKCLKFMYYLNYVIAIMFLSATSLGFAMVMSLYQMVINKKRALNLNK